MDLVVAQVIVGFLEGSDNLVWHLGRKHFITSQGDFAKACKESFRFFSINGVAIDVDLQFP